MDSVGAIQRGRGRLVWTATWRGSLVLLFAVSACLLSGDAQAAQRYSVATGNWNNTANWSATSGGYAGATVPAAGDTVVIEGGHTVTVNASTANLTSLTISAGSQLTISPNFNVTATTITLDGTLRQNGTGTLTVTTLTVGAAGTYQHNRNGGTIPTATWAASSTCLITGSTSTEPGGIAQNFGNLTWNCAGQSADAFVNLASSIQGTLTVAATGGGGTSFDNRPRLLPVPTT
jgi:hypothetical protein